MDKKIKVDRKIENGWIVYRIKTTDKQIFKLIDWIKKYGN